MTSTVNKAHAQKFVREARRARLSGKRDHAAMWINLASEARREAFAETLGAADQASYLSGMDIEREGRMARPCRCRIGNGSLV